MLARIYERNVDQPRYLIEGRQVHSHLSYCLRGGNELGVVVIHQGLLLGVERPHLAQYPGIDAQQLLERAALQSLRHVCIRVKVGDVDLAGRHLRVLGHLERWRRSGLLFLEVVVFAKGGPVGALVLRKCSSY
jgi:hypothetical protein